MSGVIRSFEVVGKGLRAHCSEGNSKRWWGLGRGLTSLHVLRAARDAQAADRLVRGHAAARAARPDRRGAGLGGGVHRASHGHQRGHRLPCHTRVNLTPPREGDDHV